MRDKQLYSRIQDIKKPWSVTDVELSIAEGQVEVFIEHDGKKACKCSACGNPCPGYDQVVKKWRHLDTCQFKTILVASVPVLNALIMACWPPRFRGLNHALDIQPCLKPWF